MKPTVTLLSLLAAVALFWLSGRQQPALTAMRTAYGLTPAGAAEGAPPTMAFTTILLGGFRGLLADMLWLRVSRLQNEGRYFELVQLADWITKLEPRSTGTWAYHAWNMAYNVSAMMAEPAERWQWVQNGIKLLRDEGLRYNPQDARLHFELGWIYQHKLGLRMDPDVAYYQQQLALAVEAVLPGGRLDSTVLAPGAPLRETLQRKLDLDAGLMLEIDARYGPLDWRLPETHALYWACRGIQRSGDTRNLMCGRMRYQSLATSFFRGTLTMDPRTGVFERSPRPELLDQILREYRRALAEPNWPHVRESYISFLENASQVLTSLGRPADAARVGRLLQAQQKQAS